MIESRASALHCTVHSTLCHAAYYVGIIKPTITTITTGSSDYKKINKFDICQTQVKNKYDKNRWCELWRV